MGRAPCCDKANVKRGPWSPEEDMALKTYLERHGPAGNWISLPQKAVLLTSSFDFFFRPQAMRWSVIASRLPGRTDNDVKNYWNTRLKKKLVSASLTRYNSNTITAPPPPAAALKPKSEIDKYTSPTSFTPNSTTSLSSKHLVFGQNTEQPYFPFPQANSEYFGGSISSTNTTYISSSSQEVSTLSSVPYYSFYGENHYESWANNGDEFLMDFGLGSSTDFVNGVVLQGRNNEAPLSLANSSLYESFLANTCDTKPQGGFYQSVTN
ncbi:hypothetical protein GIB67_002472 [Kingdonia uniflora]|uniref:Uncharacterized protein n=1 Tax=Kingdonia uniflora TaxID=39325 RepID=A0A7J7LAI8_9MAGN|nr:hypothetical protein GIB67_002472 [Kingdonia uniflora]